MKRETPTRQQPSGAAKRRAKRERLEREVAPLRAAWDAKWAALGPPPDEGVQRLEWGNKAAALTVWETACVPALRDKADRKLILEGVRTIGMTAVRALYEERFRQLERMIYGPSRRPPPEAKLERDDSGLEDLDEPHPPKAPTSTNGRKP